MANIVVLWVDIRVDCAFLSSLLQKATNKWSIIDVFGFGIWKRYFAIMPIKWTHIIGNPPIIHTIGPLFGCYLDEN